MPTSLQSINKKRSGEYRKDVQEENFLREINQLLQSNEQTHYRNWEIAHPFIFVFGPPRSGTTLLSQLIAHSLDVGYINNLTARFWLAPVYGIKLSRSVLGERRKTSFQSQYARTAELTDIHEFGYFWRYWLKKETLEDIIQVAEREETIDWTGLKKTLANMQHEFDRPMIFKNIFGSYHLQKLKQVLGKVLYVYIERDPLDTAISILEARKKYYSDLNTWWSYAPVEYGQLKGRNYWEQIAGQVYFLQRYYNRQIQNSGNDIALKVAYQEVCRHPGKVVERLQTLAQKRYGSSLELLQQPPEKFPFRTYENREEEKTAFRRLLKKFKAENP